MKKEDREIIKRRSKKKKYEVEEQKIKVSRVYEREREKKIYFASRIDVISLLLPLSSRYSSLCFCTLPDTKIMCKADTHTED